MLFAVLQVALRHVFVNNFNCLDADHGTRSAHSVIGQHSPSPTSRLAADPVWPHPRGQRIRRHRQKTPSSPRCERLYNPPAGPDVRVAFSTL